MNARQSPTPAPGPDLLARYLNAYVQARQMSDVERPWGLGDDGLDALWTRLMEAIHSDPERLNRIVAEELNDTERNRIIETLVPLIFALPLREYPAELRATRSGPRLVLTLRHLQPASAQNGEEKSKNESQDQTHECPPEKSLLASDKPARKRSRAKESSEIVGYIPSALTGAFAKYLRRVLHWSDDQHFCSVTISSGGRRRRVRVALLAHGRGISVRFIERLKSPADD
jgi:hypothetical protein